MQLDRLRTYFETSPSIKLFRAAQNAPFVIDFLHRQFKDAGRITIPHSELLGALLEYREATAETHGDVLRDKPEQYLTAWCSGEQRWLRRFVEAGRNEPVYQLTPHVEDVLTFLAQALERELGFVGTESRLRVVIDLLADLVAGATRDPDVRLRHLRDARARIDDEITRVLVDGVAATLEPAAVRERFATAVTMLKHLLGDFRAVEDRFKDITRQVQRRQVDGGQPRGDILVFALDAEDVLKREDQGVSFYEFVRFILSPAQQQRLESLTVELGRIGELSSQAEGLTAIRRMVPGLLAEAEKVMRTNQRLSSTLRRLLDDRSASERQRLARLVGEIKSAAAELADGPQPDGVTAWVDRPLKVRSPFGRTFWSRPAEFVTTDLTELAADDAQRARAFALLSGLHHLDWRAMRRRVADVARRHAGAGLRDVLLAYPPAGGVVEVLGYLQIAQDDRHIVDASGAEEVVVREPSAAAPGLRLRVPLVMFFPPAEGVHGESGSDLPA